MAAACCSVFAAFDQTFSKMRLDSKMRRSSVFCWDDPDVLIHASYSKHATDSCCGCLSGVFQTDGSLPLIGVCSRVTRRRWRQPLAALTCARRLETSQSSCNLRPVSTCSFRCPSVLLVVTHSCFICCWDGQPDAPAHFLSHSHGLLLL